MKKISFVDVLIAFLILAVIGISIFLFLLIRKLPSNSKNASPQNSSNTLLLTPVVSLSGIVNEIKGNSIFFTPYTQSLSFLEASGSSDTTYEAKVNQKTIFNKTSGGIPYVSPDRVNDTIIKNIVFKDVKPGESLTVLSATKLTQKTILADQITVYSNPFFISGEIVSVQGDSVEILSPSVGNPTEELIKTLNIKRLQVLITPKTEVGYKSASVSGIIKKDELSVKDVVFIFSYDNPDINKTITAETITVQRF